MTVDLPPPRTLLGGLLTGLVLFVGPSVRAADAGAGIDFNRQIRPILSENCFACHGPDEKARKGKLRLDTREGILGHGRGGTAAVVPGKPGASEVMARVLASDGSEVMPPVKSGKKLSREQVELIRQWIEQGAHWSEHWAFTPPRRPAVPAVANTGLTRNPIDHFVLSRLEREKLSPAPEADRATLIRRLSLDLTGLPPTPAEVDAFLSDKSADAYEKVVDRLLASPRYGERMAMLWLDGARYADSNGYQADYERFMWRWRDWVIDAYNANMPFDRFTLEQLAGDLLPEPPPGTPNRAEQRMRQVLATGFHRNHRINTEGGIVPEEWRVETVADRVETTGNVWLGLTFNCCRCHDHKYDPISQKEYYQLFAFFNNVPESGTGREAPVNHPPILRAPRPGDEARLRELEAAIGPAERAVKEQEERLAALQPKWEKHALTVKGGPTWTHLEPTDLRATDGVKLTRQPDGDLRATGRATAHTTYTVTAPLPLKKVTALRLEVLPHEGLPARGPGRSENGNFVLTGVTVEMGGKKVTLASASTDFSQANYPVAAVLGGRPDSGWAIFPRVGQAHWAVFALEKPLSEEGAKVTIHFDFNSHFPGHQFGRFRLAVSDADTPLTPGELPGNIRTLLAIAPEKRTPQQQGDLRAFFRAHHAGEVTAADRALQAARKAKADFEATLPTAMVLAEMPSPRDAFVLIRGQYDKRGEKVTARLPSVLPPLPKGSPANRLGLARWLVDPNHPLTSRVAVNRMWEVFFGAGIVRSTENFGLQGEPPTHPELLDWLAVEFVRNGWDIKAIQRLIVTSTTYRQSSRVTPELLARDPDNRLLARAPRFRLQAEAVRDNALAVSGLLVDRLGGPSVRPYMPQGVWDETNVYGNLRNYRHDKGDGLYRRSLYTIWKRTAAPPSMLLFDSPSRELCTVKRPRTNTPLQALALLNEVTFVEASRVLAERMLSEGGKTPEEWVRHAFRRAVARQPEEAELRVLTAGLKKRLERYRSDPEAARKLLSVGDHSSAVKLDPAELAACTVTASVILNLDETITRE
jgi:mono/diheme cytochrome c family protein